METGKVVAAAHPVATQTLRPHNKELERTRSTQTAWGPRRSIQC